MQEILKCNDYEEIVKYILANSTKPEKLISNLDKTHAYSLPKLNKSVTLQWVCPDCKGASFKTMTAMELRACKFCKGKAILIGFNDLETYCKENEREEILNEWDESNLHSPKEFTYKSNKTITLKCLLNHVWSTTPKKRVNNIVGCPYCSDQKLFSGFNDLETKLKNEQKSAIVEYWDYSKNSLSPDKVFKTDSNWWKCFDCDDSFFCRNVKMYLGRLCLKCRNKSKSSFLERSVVSFLKETYPDIKISENSRFGDYHNFELDIHLKEKSLGIEVNGEYWHSGKTWSQSAKKKIENGWLTAQDYHQAKLDSFKQDRIKLAFLWESDWLNMKDEIQQDLRNFVENSELSERLMRLE